MKKHSEESHRLLIILKNDSKALHDRIVKRKREYLMILSLKRTRDHFKDIFKSVYDTITIEQLQLCSEDVLSALDKFYGKVEEVKWFLNHTEEMPAMVEDKMKIFEREIKTLYDTLTLYLNAEIGVVEEESDQAS